MERRKCSVLCSAQGVTQWPIGKLWPDQMEGPSEERREVSLYVRGLSLSITLHLDRLNWHLFS